MKRIVRALAASVSAGVVAALSVVGTAQSVDIETTPPLISVPVVPSFVVGSQVGDPSDVDGDGRLYFMDFGAARQYKFTVTDPSGVCGYYIHQEYGVDGWTIGEVVNAGPGVFTDRMTGTYNYTANQYPRSDSLSRVQIAADDCADNSAGVMRLPYGPSVMKDYGSTIPTGWGRTSCTCAIGDSMLRTSTYKASLSTVVNSAGGTKRVALIMAKGPARGKAQIYYDGAYVKTVDTYASVNTNRIVMWDKTITGSSNHTIKVVNLATAGRPRIDIDAYIQ